MNAKPVVFISHIDDEKEIASAFKSLIESSFLGLINVFVSSDARSIELGDRWLNTMTDALKTCAIEVIICSPISVMRPWINFEAGAGWVRDIPVVPLCHSGIQPANLPLPLNLLQGANLNEVSSLRLEFKCSSSRICRLHSESERL
jgi:TIR domain